MDFKTLASSRRSIRSFLDKPVENELVIQLLEAAQSAPSGGNCQPWHFYIIKSKDKIAEISTQAVNQSFVAKAPVIIVVCADIVRSEEKYGDRGRNLYCLQDTAAAIQNILLCASSLSLGACWCGDFDEMALSKVLELDKDMRPVAILPVGYYTNEPAMPKRRALNEIATFLDDSRQTAVIEQKEKENAFEHCDMGSTLFNDVNLSLSKFSNVNMAQAEFSGVNMAQGEFSDVNMAQVEFSNINMAQAEFSNINMTQADFGGMRLDESKFGCVDMKKVNYRNVKLNESMFSDCEFKNVKLTNCNLSNMSISESDISGLKINGVEIKKLLDK